MSKSQLQGQVSENKIFTKEKLGTCVIAHFMVGPTIMFVLQGDFPGQYIKLNPFAPMRPREAWIITLFCPYIIFSTHLLFTLPLDDYSGFK